MRANQISVFQRSCNNLGYFALATSLLVVLATFGLWSPGFAIIFATAMFVGIFNGNTDRHRTLVKTGTKRVYLTLGFLVTAVGCSSWLLFGRNIAAPMRLSRDPGVYSLKNIFLSRTNGLSGVLGRDVFTDVGPGQYLESGNVYFQFPNGSTVWLGAVWEYFGSHTNQVVGLSGFVVLIIFLMRLALDLTGSYLVSGLVSLLFSTSIPVINLIHGGLTELWLLLISLQLVRILLKFDDQRVLTSSDASLFLFGLGSASPALFRLDGLLICLGMLVYIVIILRRIRCLRARVFISLGFLVVLLIALGDALLNYPQYASHRLRELLPLYTCAFSLILILLLYPCLFLERLQRLKKRLLHTPRLPHVPSRFLFGGLISLLLLGGTFLLPLFYNGKSGVGGLSPEQSLVAGLQSRDGAVIDSARDYSEYALSTVAWYFGFPTAILFCVGVGLIAVDRDQWKAVLTFLPIVPAALVYTYDWRIFPDQPWASRRMVWNLYLLCFLVIILCARWLMTKTHRIQVLTCGFFSLLVLPTFAANLIIASKVAPFQGESRVISEVCAFSGRESMPLIIDDFKVRPFFELECDGVVVSRVPELDPSVKCDHVVYPVSSVDGEQYTFVPLAEVPPKVIYRDELTSEPRQVLTGTVSTVVVALPNSCF